MLSGVLLMVLSPVAWSLLLDADEQSYPADHLEFHKAASRKSPQSMHCHSDDIKCKDGVFTSNRCWGYEAGCDPDSRYSYPTCDRHHPSWSPSLEAQRKLFWEQADFGYLKAFLDQEIDICSPRQQGDSSLRCVTHDRFCRAKNLYVDLRKINFKGANERFREDLFSHGDIGGSCELNRHLHDQQNGYKSPLQSWYAELQNYSDLDFNPIMDGKCDVIFEKPVFLIKLDAGINMYHHFCDFVNLYASQHMNGSFSQDVNIIMWDTSELGYMDIFSETWKAFSLHPISRLSDYQGKKLCFVDAVFPLLARMVRGLFFNMPLVPYCHGSGLFRSFSHHVLHRLDVKQDALESEEVRITLITRKTKYRNIINEQELLGAMRRVKFLKAQIVHYDHRALSFVEQVRISHNSDILIGMHGAGLTHLLFLPDWGSIFEIYNTEDPDCYLDLARLRGISYFTWEDKSELFQEDEGHHPTLGAHAKFTNYAFNVNGFMRTLTKAIKDVLRKRSKIR